MATSYDAAIQNQALLGAEARLDQALVAYFPKLTLTGSYTRVSPVTYPGFTFNIPVDNYLLQASLIVPLSDYLLRTSQSYAAASHSVKASELDGRAARLKSGLEGRVAYYTWLRVVAQLRVAERNLQVMQAHLADARNGLRAGTASQADVMGAESHVANAELVVEQERNAVAAAEDQIRIAMHDASGRPLVMGEDLRSDAETDAGDMARPIDSWRAEALDKRLEIRALDETVWSLREQARAAKATLYPRLDGFGDIVYANPNSRIFPPTAEFKTTWDVGVRLTWTPNDTFSGSGIVAEAQARAAQTEMQKAKLVDGLKTEVLQAHQALAQAHVAIDTTARALAGAEESYRVRRELFRNGRATSVELQDAEVALFRAGFESVNARANLKIARARLRHAVGRDAGDAASVR